MKKPKKPLSVSEYAKKEGISRQGVYSRIAAKHIKTIKLQPKVNYGGIWYNYGREKTFVIADD